MGVRAAVSTRSQSRRAVVQLAIAALLLGLMVPMPDDSSLLWRVGFAAAAVALMGWNVRVAVAAQRRSGTRPRALGSTILPAWATSLPEGQYQELQTIVCGLERRVRSAEQAAQHSRHRATQSLSGLWQVVASAVTSEERVRGRFVADLHDSVVQTIIVCTYLAEDEDTSREQLAGHLREAERQLRDIMVLTRPPELTSGSLGSAVRFLTRSLEVRSHLEVDWDWPGTDAEVPQVLALTLYRFFQESLNNVAKHAGVDQAEAGLELGDEVVAWVRDRGAGFVTADQDASANGHHVGLELMTDRAQQIGARIDVVSSPGAGTTVTFRVPMPPTSADRMVQLGSVRSTQPVAHSVS